MFGWLVTIDQVSFWIENSLTEVNEVNDRDSLPKVSMAGYLRDSLKQNCALVTIKM